MDRSTSWPLTLHVRRVLGCGRDMALGRAGPTARVAWRGLSSAVMLPSRDVGSRWVWYLDRMVYAARNQNKLV